MLLIWRFYQLHASQVVKELCELVSVQILRPMLTSPSESENVTSVSVPSRSFKSSTDEVLGSRFSIHGGITSADNSIPKQQLCRYGDTSRVSSSLSTRSLGGAFLSLFLAFHCLHRHFPSRKRLFCSCQLFIFQIKSGCKCLKNATKGLLVAGEKLISQRMQLNTFHFTTMTQVVTKDLQYADTASTMSVLLNTQGTRKRIGGGGTPVVHCIHQFNEFHPSPEKAGLAMPHFTNVP